MTYIASPIFYTLLRFVRIGKVKEINITKCKTHLHPQLQPVTLRPTWVMEGKCLAKLYEESGFLEVCCEVSTIIWDCTGLVCNKPITIWWYTKKRKTKKLSTGKLSCDFPPFLVPLECIHC